MDFSAASLSCRYGNVKENPPFLQQKRSFSASEQLSNLQNRTFLWDLFVLVLCRIFLCSLLLIPERHAEPPKPNHTAYQTEHISKPRSDDCHNETENQNRNAAQLLLQILPIARLLFLCAPSIRHCRRKVKPCGMKFFLTGAEKCVR